MTTIINKIDSVPGNDSIIYLVSDIKYISTSSLSGSELKYIEKQKNTYEKDLIWFNRANKMIFIQFIKKDKEIAERLEALRKSGDKIASLINDARINKITISDTERKTAETLALAEGIALGNYQFLKYKIKDLDKQKNSLQKISVLSTKLKEKELNIFSVVLDAVTKCRDLVNYPVCYLTALKLSKEFKSMYADTGVKIEVLSKKKIEALKMNGLLAVNQGSVDPPTFNIVEWKPETAVNKKPVVLVGKGVVYDTGGMNIKIHDYMNDMKSDMAGAAAVASAIYAIAKLELPVHIIGLVPATDNRTDGNAMVSGDVITMHDGTTVEVINTDAEGRLILADALSYAKKYNPGLVIDIATLTGSALRAIGKNGMVGMQTKADEQFARLKESGNKVFERIAEFPFWDDYAENLKSDIADIKNLGGVNAGTITAGKFLEHFTDYPYIHLDIAGPCFNTKRDSYRGTGGSGVGVRLFVDFITEFSKSQSE